MKKNVVLILSLLLSCAYAQDYYQFCSTKTPNRNIQGAISSVLGMNILSRNIIENQIERAIKKETNSKFTIKINNFFMSNILSGEFKSISAKSKRLTSDGLYLSNIKANSICNYNKVSFKDNNLFIDENIVLKFSAQITQDDLEKTINSENYKKAIEKLNNDKTISKFIKITNSNVSLKGNQLLFKYELTPKSKYKFIFGSKPIKLSFRADLKVIDGKVKMCNFDLNENISTYGLLLPIVNKLNPTTWDLDFDENTKGKLDFSNVKIKDEKIYLEGFVVINKNN